MSMDLAGFAISAGSACSSGKVRASKVLRAMGYDAVQSASAIRISIGPGITREDVLRFSEAWARGLQTDFGARGLRRAKGTDMGDQADMAVREGVDVETINTVNAMSGKYKHGWDTDIDTEFAPKGLSEDIVRLIPPRTKNQTGC